MSCRLNKMKKGYGILLIDKNYNACLLQRHYPYRIPDVEENQKDHKSQYFLEKINIPKGRKMDVRESDIDAARREFIEETLCSNSTFCILNKFKLYWRDVSVLWEYYIYICKTEELLRFFFYPKELVRFYLNVGRNRYIGYVKENYNYDIVILNIFCYIDIIRNHQIRFYKFTNYKHFLRNIRNCLKNTEENYYCYTKTYFKNKIKYLKKNDLKIDYDNKRFCVYRKEWETFWEFNSTIIRNEIKSNC